MTFNSNFYHHLDDDDAISGFLNGNDVLFHLDSPSGSPGSNEGQFRHVDDKGKSPPKEPFDFFQMDIDHGLGDTMSLNPTEDSSFMQDDNMIDEPEQIPQPNPKEQPSRFIDHFQDGCVEFESLKSEHSIAMIDNILSLRKLKCVAFDVKFPFKLYRDIELEMTHKVYCKPSNQANFVGILCPTYVQYKFGRSDVRMQVPFQIPESAIDLNSNTARIPFILTLGQKELTGGYKNTFIIAFQIRSKAHQLITQISIMYKIDSRGKKETEQKEVIQSLGACNNKDYVYARHKTSNVIVQLPYDTSLLSMRTFPMTDTLQSLF